MSPRAAEIDIRRRGLEVGISAELPTDSASPLAIIAQSPAAGAQGVASPRVSLLYAATPPDPAYAMPDLTGATLTEATALITASGLKTLAVTTLSSSPNSPTNPFTNLDFHPAAPIVVGQTPAPGTRVTPSTDISLQVTRAF
jgi:beta-lactam-binding protein with PASTA domain